MREMMYSPFINDPFPLVWRAFKNLYPDKQCEIWYAPNEEDGCGFTNFPDDGSVPQVVIFIGFDTEIQMETLGHELAHVAVGKGHGHDEAWEKAFRDIQKEYERVAEEIARKHDKAVEK